MARSSEDLDDGYELDPLLYDIDDAAPHKPVYPRKSTPWYYRAFVRPFRRRTRQNSPIRLIARICIYIISVAAVTGFLFSLLLAVFVPIYAIRPDHYDRFAQRALSSTDPGRGNPHNQKVFIAANIINADLIRGHWGSSVRQLVDLLGPENTFVSVYDNDSEPETKEALLDFGQQLNCESSIVTGVHMDLTNLSRVELPDGSSGIKRIEYMAEIRNQALRPLTHQDNDDAPLNEGFKRANTTFDYVLFLNDVYFNPLEAAELLFLTNSDEMGLPQYEAACAVDFMSVTNFYDSYASRDYEGFGLGYGPGFRLFPWFASEGSSRTREAIFAGSDAVPVQACWGGMTAFRAHYFQQTQAGGNVFAGADADADVDADVSRDEVSVQDTTVRFRSENEIYWDASECCLVHADISMLYQRSKHATLDHVVFLNPYIRTAYTAKTFSWLWTVARFEHGFSPLQKILTMLTAYPKASERRTEQFGDLVEHRIYSFSNDTESDGKTPRGGEYLRELRRAQPGGFCGLREMSVMEPDFKERNKKGLKPYTTYPAP